MLPLLLLLNKALNLLWCLDTITCLTVSSLKKNISLCCNVNVTKASSTAFCTSVYFRHVGVMIRVIRPVYGHLTIIFLIFLRGLKKKKEREQSLTERGMQERSRDSEVLFLCRSLNNPPTETRCHCNFVNQFTRLMAGLVITHTGDSISANTQRLKEVCVKH